MNFEAYYFKIKNEEYTTKLLPVMNGLENILESASVYFSDKLNLTVIETRGNNIKSKIDKAKEYFNKYNIKYIMEKVTANSPFDLKHI